MRSSQQKNCGLTASFQHRSQRRVILITSEMRRITADVSVTVSWRSLEQAAGSPRSSRNVRSPDRARRSRTHCRKYARSCTHLAGACITWTFCSVISWCWSTP